MDSTSAKVGFQTPDPLSVDEVLGRHDVATNAADIHVNSCQDQGQFGLDFEPLVKPEFN